jgi:hypothetical protein
VLAWTSSPCSTLARLELVKQTMMIVMDKLGPGDRLSIVSSQTRNHRFMELRYMSGEHDGGRDDAMYKISQLRATGRCTGHIASTALQMGAQVYVHTHSNDPYQTLSVLVF